MKRKMVIVVVVVLMYTFAFAKNMYKLELSLKKSYKLGFGLD